MTTPQQDRQHSHAFRAVNIPPRIVAHESSLLCGDPDQLQRTAKRNGMWLAPTDIPTEHDRIHGIEQPLTRQLLPPDPPWTAPRGIGNNARPDAATLEGGEHR